MSGQQVEVPPSEAHSPMEGMAGWFRHVCIQSSCKTQAESDLCILPPPHPMLVASQVEEYEKPHTNSNGGDNQEESGS